jgi:hypothetical protein
MGRRTNKPNMQTSPVLMHGEGSWLSGRRVSRFSPSRITTALRCSNWGPFPDLRGSDLSLHSPIKTYILSWHRPHGLCQGSPAYPPRLSDIFFPYPWTALEPLSSTHRPP